MSETALSKAINDTLESLGHVVIRVHSGTIRALPPGGKGRPYWMQLAIKGTPDRVVLSPNGLTTWLEVKTKTGRLSPDQKRWHERANKGGHRVVVVRSVADALAAVNDSPVRNLSLDRVRV